MTDSETEMNAMKSRLKQLESDSRGLRITCVLLFIMAALSLFQNFSTRGRLLDVYGNLNVGDDVEMSRAIIHADKLSSGLTLYDDDDQSRAMFIASQNGSGLTLRDVQANQRMLFRVNEAGPEIMMADANQRIRLSLRIEENGARMLFFDESGETTFDTAAAADTGDAAGSESALHSAGTP